MSERSPKAGIPFEGRGFYANGEGLYVGRLPGRKTITLYENTNGGTMLKPLARLEDEEAAERVLEWLDRLLEAKETE